MAIWVGSVLFGLCMQAIQEARQSGLQFEWEKQFGGPAIGGPATAAQSATQGDTLSSKPQGQSWACSSSPDIIVHDRGSETDDDLIDLVDDESEA